jgi:superfamily II DNA helicase RecQ
MLQELYQNEMLARFIIDEAHCVSSWGHDFRKDYAALGALKQEFPEAPIVALTATARMKVIEDIVGILGMPHCRRFHSGQQRIRYICADSLFVLYHMNTLSISRYLGIWVSGSAAVHMLSRPNSMCVLCTGFDRPNLVFKVIVKPPSLGATLQAMLTYILRTFPTSTGIVYCMTKRDCEMTADFLRDHGIQADYYHAGQGQAERKSVQAAWLRGHTKVVCATIAYGNPHGGCLHDL